MIDLIAEQQIKIGYCKESVEVFKKYSEQVCVEKLTIVQF